MPTRFLSLTLFVCLLTVAAAFGQVNPGTGYVFELPGSVSAGSGMQGFLYNGSFLAPEIPTETGPQGAHQLIAKPDGTKFYIVGTGAGALQTVDPTFTRFQTIAGISGVICTATMTPDGKYLLIGSAGGSVCGPNSNSNLFYVLDTSSNALVTTSLTQQSAGVIGFAVSPDASTAWMLTNSPSTGAAVTAISLSSLGQTGKLSMPYGYGTSIALAPSGLLYVTGGGAIYEITTTGTASTCNQTFVSALPLCITTNGYMTVQATPGLLHFTPSGQTAYAVNTDVVDYGRSLVQLNVAGHAVSAWPATASGNPLPTFSDVIVAGENQIYALSTTDPNYPTTLWDVNTSSLSASIDTALNMFQANSVISAVVSNEVPTPLYLYALIDNGNQTLLYRVRLSDKTYIKQLALLGPGLLQFAMVPPVSGASGFYAYSPSTQTLASGVYTTQLSALVLDSTGRPVYKQPVTFTELPSDPVTGVVISGATASTNANGYAAAQVQVPTKAGTYTVVLAAGADVTNFAITVPGSGGGGNTSSPQVTIYSGNGEFMQEHYPPFPAEPLTIKVVSTTGTPLAGVPVTFAITGDAIGQLDSTTGVTDANGLAGTDFVSPNLPPGVTEGFDSTTVNASTSLGSVNFVVTVYRVFPNGTAGGNTIPQVPEFAVVQPVSRQLTVGEGDVLANGIIESIQTTYPGISQPVPNVGIRLASGSDYTAPGPASCQGSSLSDSNGLAHCNVFVSCQAGLGFVSGGINVVVGENSVLNFNLDVVPGTSQAVTASSGSGQSGSTGTTLPNQLIARVTDNCGNVHTGVPVTWSVTQGSATLNNTLSTSDSGGNVHTSVVLGQTAGTISITVSAGSSQAVFTVTATQPQVPAPFFTGEVSLGSGVYYLQFSDGKPFGFYNFVASSLFYHYDMGYEGFVAGPGTDVYLYDFATRHWFYTNPGVFPYLYDFTLGAWIYYFPNTANPGHYTTSPRYFADLATGQIFTM